MATLTELVPRRAICLVLYLRALFRRRDGAGVVTICMNSKASVVVAVAVAVAVAVVVGVVVVVVVVVVVIIVIIVVIVVGVRIVGAPTMPYGVWIFPLGRLVTKVTTVLTCNIVIAGEPFTLSWVYAGTIVFSFYLYIAQFPVRLRLLSSSPDNRACVSEAKSFLTLCTLPIITPTTGIDVRSFESNWCYKRVLQGS